jgi:hypothetical protein
MRLNFHLILLLCAHPLLAAPRDWKSADGGRSISGEYVEHDAKTITLKLANDKTVTFDLAKLHPDDLAWLEKNAADKPATASRPNPLFDQLHFGDTRAEVLEKLKQSKIVETTLDEQFIARVGLNGVFRTKQKFGGLPVTLYFHWCAKGTLTEISLQTQSLPANQYETALMPCWAAMRDLLVNLHGPAEINAELPALDHIAKDTIVPSHKWNLKPKGSLLLGPGNENGGYLIVARYTEDKH